MAAEAHCMSVRDSARGMRPAKAEDVPSPA